MAKIRFASKNDIPELVKLGKEIYLESQQKDLGFDEARLRNQIEACLRPESKNYCLFVAEREGRIIGVFWGHIDQHFFSKALVATEYMFYVKPDFRGTSVALRLMHAYKTWAENRNAQEIMICMTIGVEPEKFDRFIKKLGFQYVGGNYSMRVGAAK